MINRIYTVYFKERTAKRGKRFTDRSVQIVYKSLLPKPKVVTDAFFQALENQKGMEYHKVMDTTVSSIKKMTASIETLSMSKEGKLSAYTG